MHLKNFCIQLVHAISKFNYFNYLPVQMSAAQYLIKLWSIYYQQKNLKPWQVLQSEQNRCQTAVVNMSNSPPGILQRKIKGHLPANLWLIGSKTSVKTEQPDDSLGNWCTLFGRSLCHFHVLQAFETSLPSHQLDQVWICIKEHDSMATCYTNIILWACFACNK
jgi:hypothetical protein